MAHLIGYIGQISEDELKSNDFQNYKSGDIIGKMGIEYTYEDFLKGKDGKQLVEIESSGEVVRILGETDPVPGRDIKLTVDAKLQERAYKATSKIKKGAVIVSTPTNEILALVSRPSFDPNLFTQGQTYKTATSSGYQSVSEILTDSENQPFLNRAISGLYPPGSTFKIITSAAGLENGIIDTKYTVKDTGVLKVGEFSYANWFYTNNGGTDGDVNVVKGLKRSNDIFYYKLAEKVGLKRLTEMAYKFNAGKTLGIDLTGEAKGSVPSDKWKRENIGEPWYLGDTFHFGIGQGYLLSTPLEVHSWGQIIAADGIPYKPHILKDLGETKLSEDFLSSRTIEPIRQGMIESCAPTGVAYPFFDYKVKNPNLKIDNKNILKVASGSADMRQVVIACKTGTAQQGGEKDLPHSWITVFAPAFNPEIVVTVLAEASGEGSQVAAPIAKEIIDEYFINKK
jgi:penicillin-binding protein 2